MTARLWTVHALSQETGLDRRTIHRRLAGVTPDDASDERSPKWLLKSAGPALYGSDTLDLTAERARLAKEQADKLAMDNAVSRGELAPLAFFEDQITKYTRQVSGMLDGLPGRMRNLLPHLSPADCSRFEAMLATERQRVSAQLVEVEDVANG